MRIIKASILLLLMTLYINSFSQQLEFMGVPLRSTISDYTKVLSSHRFKDKYTAGSLAHLYWEGGDFWKQKNCYVRLYAQDDIHVDIIEVTIPPMEPPNEYIKSINELITDLSNRYGQYTCDTFDMKKETDVFFRPVHREEDLYYLFTWSKFNGELKLLVNNDYLYAIKLQYKSLEYINKVKESSRFKGQGKSDL